MTTAHPAACWCIGLGSDATCPTRWNGDVGATNCPRTAIHRRHTWHGTHPWGDGMTHRMRCRGVSWRGPHVRLRFAWYDLWVGAYVDRKNRVLYVCPLPCLLIEIRAGGAV